MVVGAYPYQGSSAGAYPADPRDIGHIGVYQPRRNLGPFENRAPSEVDARVKPGLPRLNTAHELATGLVGAWPVLSWDASELLDLTGGNDLTSGDSPSKVYDAAIGREIEIGDSGYYSKTLSASDPIRTSSAGTVAAWVRMDSWAGGDYIGIVAMWSSITTRWWLGQWGTDGSVRFQVNDSIEGTVAAEGPTGLEGDGLWHLLVGTFDEATGDVMFYVDGQHVATSTTAITSVTDSANLDIGTWDTKTAAGFTLDGAVADARIWSRALSAAEIARMYADPWALYRVTKKPDYPVLDTSNPLSDSVVVALPLSEGSGTTVADISGNGNHGTAEGGVTWNTDEVHGPYVSLDGVDGAIDIGGPYLSDGTKLEGTVSVWARTNDTGTNRGFIYTEASMDSTAPVLFFEMPSQARSGAAQFWARDNAASDYIDQYDSATYLITPSNSIDDGEWHHIAVTFTGSVGTIYLDGIPYDSKSYTYSATTLTNALIGVLRRSTGDIDFFDGDVTNFLIFDRALPASDVADLAEDPWLLYLNGDAPAATGNVTGTATFTVPTVVMAAAGTSAPPAISGTAAFSIPSVTMEAAGVVGSTDVTGTAAFLVPQPYSNAAGTARPPAIAGTAAFQTPIVVMAASGTIAVPVFAGTAAFTVPGVSMAASGTRTVPVFSGASAFSVPSPTMSASGQVFDTDRTGTAAFTVPSVTMAASGTNDVPAISGTATFNVPSFVWRVYSLGDGDSVMQITNGPGSDLYPMVVPRRYAPGGYYGRGFYIGGTWESESVDYSDVVKLELQVVNSATEAVVVDWTVPRNISVLDGGDWAAWCEIDIPAGGWYRWRVRMTGGDGDTDTSGIIGVNWGVGAVIALLGQSNQRKLSTAGGSPSLGSRPLAAALRPANQSIAAPVDVTAADGCAIIARDYYDALEADGQACPVMVVQLAEDGSSLWNEANSISLLLGNGYEGAPGYWLGTLFDKAMDALRNVLFMNQEWAVPVECLIYQQGEAEAILNGPSLDSYGNQLQRRAITASMYSRMLDQLYDKLRVECVAPNGYAPRFAVSGCGSYYGVEGGAGAFAGFPTFIWGRNRSVIEGAMAFAKRNQDDYPVGCYGIYGCAIDTDGIHLTNAGAQAAAAEAVKAAIGLAGFQNSSAAHMGAYLRYAHMGDQSNAGTGAEQNKLTCWFRHARRTYVEVATGITKASPTVFTLSNAHGYATSETFYVEISGFGGDLADGSYTATATGANTLTIAVDTSADGATYDLDDGRIYVARTLVLGQDDGLPLWQVIDEEGPLAVIAVDIEAGGADAEGDTQVVLTLERDVSATAGLDYDWQPSKQGRLIGNGAVWYAPECLVRDYGANQTYWMRDNSPASMKALPSFGVLSGETEGEDWPLQLYGCEMEQETWTQMTVVSWTAGTKVLVVNSPNSWTRGSGLSTATGISLARHLPRPGDRIAIYNGTTFIDVAVVRKISSYTNASSTVALELTHDMPDSTPASGHTVYLRTPASQAGAVPVQSFNFRRR